MEYTSYIMIGAFAGFFAGLLGIGGGAIIAPLLIIIFTAHPAFDPAVATHIAVGTSLGIIIFTSSASATTHARLANVHYRTAAIMSAGAIIGAAAGAHIATAAPHTTLQLAIAAILLTNSYRMLCAAATGGLTAAAKVTSNNSTSAGAGARLVTDRPAAAKVTDNNSASVNAGAAINDASAAKKNPDCAADSLSPPATSDGVCPRSPPAAATLGGAAVAIGAVSAVTGLGGGALTVPFLARRALPIRLAIGTSSVIGLPLALAATAGFVIAGADTPNLPPLAWGFVYLPALAAIAASSMLFAAIGARLTQRLPTAILRKTFGILSLIIAARILWIIFA